MGKKSDFSEIVGSYLPLKFYFYCFRIQVFEEGIKALSNISCYLESN